MLVTKESNVTWLTGFSGDSSWLLIGPDLELMVSDTRYTTQIKDECPGLDTIIRDAGSTITDAVAKTVKKSKLKNLRK